MDFKEIKRLISLVEEANISHFSIEEDGVKMEVRKEFNTVAQAPVVNTVAVPAPQAVAAPAAAPEPELFPAEDAPAAGSGIIEVKSEMVGTFYISPSPDSPPFVKVGDSVSSGQVICIIEAMKLFNEIESDASGVVEKVCVENGQPVEFGQVLFHLRA